MERLFPTLRGDNTLPINRLGVGWICIPEMSCIPVESWEPPRWSIGFLLGNNWNGIILDWDAISASELLNSMFCKIEKRIIWIEVRKFKKIFSKLILDYYY